MTHRAVILATAEAEESYVEEQLRRLGVLEDKDLRPLRGNAAKSPVAAHARTTALLASAVHKLGEVSDTVEEQRIHIDRLEQKVGELESKARVPSQSKGTREAKGAKKK
jgi:hypothetical protein